MRAGHTVHGSINELRDAAASLSTCFESASTAAVADAQRQIKDSTVVAFLGFGYSDENLQRLDLKSHLRADAVVVGSDIGCTDAQRRVQRYLPDGMTLGAYGGGTPQQCLAPSWPKRSSELRPGGNLIQSCVLGRTAWTRDLAARRCAHRSPI